MSLYSLYQSYSSPAEGVSLAHARTQLQQEPANIIIAMRHGKINRETQSFMWIVLRRRDARTICYINLIVISDISTAVGRSRLVEK